MDNIWFLIAAYSAIWILLGYYFIRIGRKVDKLNERLDMLESENSPKK